MTEVAPQNGSIPAVNSLFEQPWWLDIVAPGAWGAAEVKRGDEVVARLPYARRRRLGLMTIVQPLFTQTLGPWVSPTEGKPSRRADTERALLGQLIEMLPPFDIFRQCCATSLTNWLPFYWAGFEATVRYTYRIEDLTDLDVVQRGFQEHVRRGIRKASKAVEVDHDYPLEDLLRLDVKTYERQGLKLPHSHEKCSGGSMRSAPRAGRGGSSAPSTHRAGRTRRSTSSGTTGPSTRS